MNSVPANPIRYDFFISYTSDDLEWANWVAWALNANGYTTFTAADIQAGQHIDETIEQAIITSKYVLAIISSSYLYSHSYSNSTQGVYLDLENNEHITKPALITVIVHLIDDKDLDSYDANNSINLVVLDEKNAERALVSEIVTLPGLDPALPNTERRRASHKPRFPGIAGIRTMAERNRQLEETYKEGKKSIMTWLVIYCIILILGIITLLFGIYTASFLKNEIQGIAVLSVGAILTIIALFFMKITKEDENNLNDYYLGKMEVEEHIYYALKIIGSANLEKKDVLRTTLVERLINFSGMSLPHKNEEENRYYFGED